LKDPSPEEGRDMSHGENAGGLGGGYPPHAPWILEGSSLYILAVLSIS